MVELPFLKKKEPEMIRGKGFAPVDRVREMASRGFSEPEMIDVLRRDGFSAEEIDKALTQALRLSVAGETKAFPTLREEPKLPTFEEIRRESASPQVPETSLPSEYYSYPTEEYVDYVVQSRVAEVNEKINEFGIRYHEIEKRIEQINAQLNEILKTRGGELQTLLNKIDSFKENAEDVNNRLAGLERAFREALPALIESVRALSDLVQRFKKEA